MNAQVFNYSKKFISRQLRSSVDLSLANSELNGIYETTPKHLLNCVACKAGCSHCCRVPVEVKAHEVLFASQHPNAAQAIAKLQERRTIYQSMSNAERANMIHECPLLVDGKCSIYENRPEACMAWHSSDATSCRDFPNDSRSCIPDLRIRMVSSMLGIDQAFIEAGYDKRPYDFSSALHEVLTTGDCMDKWTKKQTVFSDSCLAPKTT